MLFTCVYDAQAKIVLFYFAVPPRIEDSLSSGDKVRTEGSNVTLECTARGSPKPTVTWKRENGNNINIDKSRNVSGEYTKEAERTTAKEKYAKV